MLLNGKHWYKTEKQRFLMLLEWQTTAQPLSFTRICKAIKNCVPPPSMAMLCVPQNWHIPLQALVSSTMKLHKEMTTINGISLIFLENTFANNSDYLSVPGLLQISTFHMNQHEENNWGLKKDPQVFKSVLTGFNSTSTLFSAIWKYCTHGRYFYHFLQPGI